MKQIKNNGITLVALVVTIIILLILAGVSISALSGSGLFGKARLAEQKSEEAEILENEILDNYINNINEYMAGGTRNAVDINISNDNLKAWLNTLGTINIDIEDILNNGILSKLMNSKNSVDYMLSNEEIMNAVLNSENAMKELSKSEYAGYKAITSDKWKEKLLASKYINIFDEHSKKVETLTNNTNVLYSSYYSSGYQPYYAFDNNSNTSWISTYGDISNGYIGYDFNENVMVYKVSVLNCSTDIPYNEAFLTGKLQYYDGSNWTDISSTITFDIQYQTIQHVYPNSNKSVSKWRLKGITSPGERYIACRMLQFYARTIPQ